MCIGLANSDVRVCVERERVSPSRRRLPAAKGRGGGKSPTPKMLCAFAVGRPAVPPLLAPSFPLHRRSRSDYDGRGGSRAIFKRGK